MALVASPINSNPPDLVWPKSPPAAFPGPAKRFELRGESAQQITVDRGLSAIMCQIIAPSARHTAKQLSAMGISRSRVAGDVQALPPNQVVPPARTRREPLPRLSPALGSRASRAGFGSNVPASSSAASTSPASAARRSANRADERSPDLIRPSPRLISDATSSRSRCLVTKAGAGDSTVGDGFGAAIEGAGPARSLKEAGATGRSSRESWCPNSLAPGPNTMVHTPSAARPATLHAHSAIFHGPRLSGLRWSWNALGLER